MKISMLILCLVLTKHLAACSKQEPHRNNKKTTANPCCITDQFTISYADTFAGYSPDDRSQSMPGQKDDIFEGRSYVDAAFDFDNKVFGQDLIVYLYDTGIYHKYKVYDLINQNVQYVVDESGDCSMYNVGSADLPLQCVPDDASYDKSLYIGDRELLLNSWTMRGKYFDGNVSLSVTDQCIPVFTNTAGTYDDGEFVVTEGAFMNFTDTIYDRDYWFVPPPSCKNATKIKSFSNFKSLRFLKLMQDTNLFL